MLTYLDATSAAALLSKKIRSRIFDFEKPCPRKKGAVPQGEVYKRKAGGAIREMCGC
jgi:hypothetical protein